MTELLYDFVSLRHFHLALESLYETLDFLIAFLLTNKASAFIDFKNP